VSRSYHVDIARFVADADHKWVDNLLSRFEIPGVVAAHQGVTRRISGEGMYQIVLIRRLTRELGVSTEKGVGLARDLMTGDRAQVQVARGIGLALDRPSFQREVDDRIAEAVEAVVPARRGRPPHRA
jgi:hypothetical protein